MNAVFLIYELLFFFTGKIFYVKSARIELGAASATVGTHGLESADKFGAILLNDSLYLIHNGSCIRICLHAKTAASHEHKLLRVYVHHVRNGGILRCFGSVVVLLAVISLALNKMSNSNKVAAEMHRNVIRNSHFYAEIKGSYGAMLAQEQLVTPFCRGQLGAGLSNGVKSTKFA